MVQSSPNIETLMLRAQWSGFGDYSRAAVVQVTDRLGLPQDALPAVLIGGTNGKGSTAAMLSSIAIEEGRTVGLCTSPHLSRVNERIRINGEPLSDQRLDEYLGVVLEAERLSGVELSFFELALTAGFVAFERERVELAVIEVGLGGERDATNIISSPEVSAVVSVDFDHERVLGGSLAEIGYDKGGICRDARPLVVGRVSAEARAALIRRAAERGARTYLLGEDFSYEQLSSESDYPTAVFKQADGFELQYSCGLQGSHQLCNAAVALQISRLLGFSEKGMQLGLRRVCWPGRLESGTSSLGTRFMIDCAHNLAGIRALKEHLHESDLSEITIVMGLLETARWQQMLLELKGLVRSWIFLTPRSSRALSGSEIEDFARDEGLSAELFGEDYEMALAALLHKDSKYGGEVLVTGSMYMVGEFRELLVQQGIVI